MLPLLLINLLGIAGIVVWHLQGRGRPTARLVVQILFFTAMTVVLPVAGIMPHRVDDLYLTGFSAVMATCARVLWWTHLAWTLIGFVRIYIVLERRPREARLLQDLIVAIVYLSVALSILGFVFKAPIGTLIATSGVVAIIFTAEYAGRRVFWCRVDLGSAVCNRRLDRSQRRYRGKGHRKQLAVHLPHHGRS
ncbi:integral membrane protein [Rhizobium grahamii CCGE 502]|uniref:Integral membrane protein n=1 Tax=Rhizobium grahamii CCGE 502 TaxID=990285 RepID=S3HDR6_9HYPH|nr:integral membrane protein [Rhizobium grahamii CCGE 502]